MATARLRTPARGAGSYPATPDSLGRTQPRIPPTPMPPRATPVVVGLLDAGIVATTALALLTTLDPGLRVPLGLLAVSVNTPIRPALIALTLAALRLRWPPSTRSSLTSTHLLLASLAAASVGYWLRYLTTVSGGADSYGYISAAGLLADGRLITPSPTPRGCLPPTRSPRSRPSAIPRTPIRPASCRSIRSDIRHSSR